MSLEEKLKKAEETGKDIKMYYRLPADPGLIERIQDTLDERKWNMPTLITESLREFVK